MKRLLIAMLISLLVALPAAASSLSLIATAEPASILPGVPARLRITVDNQSEVPQRLPQFMVLQVRPPSGESFVPDDRGGFLVHHLPPEYLDDDTRTVRPHEKRNFDIPLGGNLTNGAMADPRLWVPGEYRLRLLFHDQLSNTKFERFGIDGMLGAGVINSPLIASSEASLRIEKPTGIDAEIWTMVLEKTKGLGLDVMDQATADRIASEIWKRSSDSPYLPYVWAHMRRRSRAEREKLANHVVERFPDHPVAEQIRLGRAQSKAYDAFNGLEELDLETVLKLTEEARAEIAAIAKEARYDLIRTRARKALADVRSRAELIELYRETPRKR